METTENWTPPKAETDGLKLYLETHLVGKIVQLLLPVIGGFDHTACFSMENTNFIYQKSYTSEREFLRVNDEAEIYRHFKSSIKSKSFLF